MADLRHVLLAALLAAGASAAAAQDLSSQRDYSDPAQRDRPIACMPGDIEGHPGKSLGELFGAAWPVHPAPSSPDAYAKPRFLKHGPIWFPQGMYPQESLDVIAILVGADGKPLRTEVLCSTRQGFAMMWRRSAMASTFAPATLEGRPVTSVLVKVFRTHPPARPNAGPPRGARH